jgi:hypothetical protein
MQRRRFFACMAWAGTGLVWTLAGGVPSASILGQAADGQPRAEQPGPGDFSFVQISDTHIGFKGEANVEGQITFHTAMSTAFPQPEPGTAPSPGPLKLPADRLRHVLGVGEVTYVQGHRRLALVDSALA